MRSQDILWFSASNLTQRGLRSWLTILGVVVGIAAVVAIVAMGQGLEAGISSQITAFGADEITISPGYSRASQGFGRMRHYSNDVTSATDEESGITDRDINILRSLPEVLFVTGKVSQRVEVNYLTEVASLTVDGVDPMAWENFEEVEIESGRLLGQGDNYAALVGSNIAGQIFSQPVTANRQIEINDKTYTVVGVLQPSLDGGTDSKILIPIDTSYQVLDDIEDNEYSTIQIKVTQEANLTAMEDMITETLLISRGKIPDEQDFTVRSSAAMSSRFSEMMGNLIGSLTGIAAVSLIVGAIGIANTMYMSVVERTRQIGVLKALGATNGDIMTVFLIESGLVGLIGGILGVLMGILVSSMMTGSGFSILPMGRRLGASSAPIFSMELILGALLFSLIVGIISGVFPARMAAQLEPVDALRYE